MGHTVIIPSFNTLEHLKNTYKSIKSYGEDVDIIIIDDASDDGTADWLLSLDDERLNRVLSPVRKGHTFWYDEGMKMAKTEVVSILHSDMIIGPGYFKNMSKHLKKGTVVCATRIEPPIHPPGKEKIVRDFGDEADNFKWDAFEKFVIQEKADSIDLTTKGIFAPWMLYKEDHLSIGGHDQRFAPYGYEDSDIFNRWILAGYKMVQSRDSLCYHMTCRGHRWNKGVGVENPDYRATMDANAREFLRKWGDWIQNDQYQYPIINPKYNKGIIVKNASPLLINTLEPWCDTLYVDTDFDGYIKKEQPKTIVDLSKRIKSIDSKKVNDIFIYVDGSNFTGTDGKNIQQLAAILEQNKPESGKFKLGNLEIEVIRYYEEIFN
jgi:glycosyltransferase involved in cell wall biosynthesis